MANVLASVYQILYLSQSGILFHKAVTVLFMEVAAATVRGYTCVALCILVQAGLFPGLPFTTPTVKPVT